MNSFMLIWSAIWSSSSWCLMYSASCFLLRPTIEYCSACGYNPGGLLLQWFLRPSTHTVFWESFQHLFWFCPYITIRRYFGANTPRYWHLQVVCCKLAMSFSILLDLLIFCLCSWLTALSVYQKVFSLYNFYLFSPSRAVFLLCLSRQEEKRCTVFVQRFFVRSGYVDSSERNPQELFEPCSTLLHLRGHTAAKFPWNIS